MPTKNKTEIHVETPMLAAIRRGLKSYQPLSGVELAVECEDHRVSTANVEMLRAAGLIVRDLIVYGDGRVVLITFSTGEQYVATGFAYGGWASADYEEESDDVQRIWSKAHALAKAAEKWLGPANDWLHYLTNMPADRYQGRLDWHEVMPPATDNDGDDGHEPPLYRDGMPLSVFVGESD